MLPEVIEIARGAGEIIRNIYEKGDFVSETKDDATPVTSADYAAHHFIMDALTALTPDIPILSEEQADISLAERDGWTTYW
ncbi:3'(2'),5'-bisphosphate nucleotidase CysQ family protein, partial [Staphylococcus pasteuri_A]